MTSERWGAFSVIDHKNTAALIPEILLYDRLVIPVPFDPPVNEGSPPLYDDRPRWEKEQWDPQGLYKRLKELGNLAVKTTWNTDRQKTFHMEMEKLRQAGLDAMNIVPEVRDTIPYQITRRILAQEQPKLPRGISHVDVVAAYQSEKDFEADFIVESAPEPEKRDLAKLGLLLGQKLAIPEDKDNPEQALQDAIKLAKKSTFKKKRRDLYEWQVRVIRDGFKPEEAIEEMEHLIDEYNTCVKNAVKKYAFRVVFTLAGVAISLAGTVFNPFSATGAVLSLVQFAAFDGKPVIEAGESKPAAMFHTVELDRASISKKLRMVI
jgi:hypothetical protein